MSTKHHLSHASKLYFGGAYDPKLFSANERKGVEITQILKASLGSPVALQAAGLIDSATSTELPNAATITYTPATNGTSPTDNAAIPTAVSIVRNSTTYSVWPMDVPRALTAAVTHASSVVAMTITVTGFDQYLQPMVETLSITATGTSKSAAGKKAFKYISSIAITSAGNATTNTASIGWGDVIGLPYKISAKSDVMQAWFNDVLETTAPTVVVGDASTVTATTGDVRGTIDLNSNMNGSAVYVYMTTNPNTRLTLLGVDNYGG